MAAVAATALPLLIGAGRGRGPGRPVTLRDPRAKYPLPLGRKEVSGRASPRVAVGPGTARPRYAGAER